MTTPFHGAPGNAINQSLSQKSRYYLPLNAVRSAELAIRNTSGMPRYRVDASQRIQAHFLDVESHQENQDENCSSSDD